jgi:hypothetical protein
MARRATSTTAWWTAAALIGAALVLYWLFHARRVETPAPPTISTGQPSLKEPPDAPAHDEIAPDEKADLERIIRERGAASPAK